MRQAIELSRPSGKPVDGVRTVSSVKDAGAAPRMIVLGFKPQTLDKVVPELQPWVTDLEGHFWDVWQRAAAGEIHVVKRRQAGGAVIGGAGTGGVILPDLHYGRDGILSVAMILQLMAQRDKPVSEIDTLARVHERVPETVSRSSVIFNGLDCPALLPEPLPTESPRLLCLGRLQRQKGFDIALSALAAMIDRFPHIRLTVAGDGPERAT